ncbi:MAG: cupin domain-containing protein [Christensenellales bacterium]
MMSNNHIVLHESTKPIITLDGRSVIWLMKPEETGGKYSSACIVEVFPGKRCKPAHAHPNGEETIYIVSGKGKALIGEDSYEIQAGSIMLFPQGVPHMLYNTGSEPLKGICFYAPVPEAISYMYYDDVDFDEFR